MAWPAKGPGSEPSVVGTVATAGSPVANGSLTPVMWVAKYWEKRVSRKMRSPMESAGGVESASVGAGGASPAEPQPPMTTSKVQAARMQRAQLRNFTV